MLVLSPWAPGSRRSDGGHSLQKHHKPRSLWMRRRIRAYPQGDKCIPGLFEFKRDFPKHLYHQVPPPLQLPGLLSLSCPDFWSAEVWKMPLDSGAVPSQGWSPGVKRETKTNVLQGYSVLRLWFVEVHQTGVDQNPNKSPQWHQWQNCDNGARSHRH